MYCYLCGKENIDEAEFCAYCGTNLVERGIVQNVDTGRNETENREEDGHSKSKRKKKRPRVIDKEAKWKWSEYGAYATVGSFGILLLLLMIMALINSVTGSNFVIWEQVSNILYSVFFIGIIVFDWNYYQYCKAEKVELITSVPIIMMLPQFVYTIYIAIMGRGVGWFWLILTIVSGVLEVMFFRSKGFEMKMALFHGLWLYSMAIWLLLAVTAALASIISLVGMVLMLIFLPTFIRLVRLMD